ncbi:MAG: CBS domain-containing protein [Labilithrix sp.]|nr:CBS domain-containing protein [Labilithrix sp.]MCW5812594.1 CBS domain-containing protein [Labilithrix sp.]
MTAAPCTVETSVSLAEAHGLMRRHRCRHLPVVRHGELVGIVSERDLYLVETLSGANQELDQVVDAMTPYVYTTTPDAKLRDVARVMAAEKYGCAVVLDRDSVIGIFTSTDAFRHLVARLG